MATVDSPALPYNQEDSLASGAPMALAGYPPLKIGYADATQF